MLGGSEFNITGPTAALVPILAHVVILHGVDALPMVAVMAGCLLLLMSKFRFGRMMRFMPGLVVIGFTAGIALSLAFGQLNAFLAVSGTNPKLEHFHERVWDTATHLSTVSPTTPLLGLVVLALLILRMKDARDIDTTALLTLEGVIEHRHRRGLSTMLSAIQPEMMPVLQRFGIIDLVGPENVFTATRDAINAVAPRASDEPDKSTVQSSIA